MIRGMLFGIFAIAGIMMLCIIVALQPTVFQVTRSVAVLAPPSAVFAVVNDLRSWREWAVSIQQIPPTRITFDGPANGLRSRLSWSGLDKGGEGSLTIVESAPYRSIGLTLQFEKPVRSMNHLSFQFKEQADQTVVTLSTTGTKKFLIKLLCMFVDVESKVGAKFEESLLQLKNQVETGGAR